MMDRYVLGSKDGSPTITINRKLSQIPRHISQNLLRLAGHAYIECQGDFGVAEYLFLNPAKLPDAELYLKEYGWKRSQ